MIKGSIERLCMHLELSLYSGYALIFVELAMLNLVEVNSSIFFRVEILDIYFSHQYILKVLSSRYLQL